MKNTLEHLPQDKRDELKLIVERILAFISPVMIILFGSYARGDYKVEADLEPGSKSGHASDYDILVITEHKSNARNTTLSRNINDSCQKLNLSAHPKIITHYLKEVNDKLAKKQYFFTDIIKDGILLYGSDEQLLKEPKELTPEEKKQIAKDYFEQSFTMAKEFYEYYEDGLKRGNYKSASFQLNQSAESCYKTILLVCTDYYPNEHHLNILGKSSEKFDDELKDIFPAETKEQREAFDLLDYAYIGGRYDKEYQITKEQLEYLAERVKVLMGLTEKICAAKIESFV